MLNTLFPDFFAKRKSEFYTSNMLKRGNSTDAIADEILIFRGLPRISLGYRVVKSSRPFLRGLAVFFRFERKPSCTRAIKSTNRERFRSRRGAFLDWVLLRAALLFNCIKIEKYKQPNGHAINFRGIVPGKLSTVTLQR